MLPETIDIRITRKCNLKCDFCFGTQCTEELCIHDWFYLLDRMKTEGVKNIVLTGGEPTLYSKINEFINYAKKMQYTIVLSTNGIELENISCLENIDVLAIPLDGKNLSDYNRVRSLSSQNYNRILSNIQFFKEKYPQKTLKIGTVLTAKNIDCVDGIYDVISNYADVWKIYQVSPHKKNMKYFKQELEVSDEIYDGVYKRLIDKYGAKIKIIPYKNRDRDGKYLFCEPNGDAVVIAKGKEKVISNFYHNFNEVVRIWSEFVEINILNDNFNQTYIFSQKREGVKI